MTDPKIVCANCDHSPEVHTSEGCRGIVTSDGAPREVVHTELCGCKDCRPTLIARVAETVNKSSVNMASLLRGETGKQADATYLELAGWWREYAETEIQGVVPKAVEYGSGDLAAIGRQMAKVMGRGPLGEREAVELGIYFYVLGKMARWSDAVEHNRDPSDDTLHDLAVYVKMAIRNRQADGWPGTNPHRKEKQA